MTQPLILVVEDDVDLRDALSDTLQMAGYEVCVAQDGRMALDVIESKDPSFVISDIQMPKMDGHALLKQAKKRWAGHHDRVCAIRPWRVGNLSQRRCISSGSKSVSDFFVDKNPQGCFFREE